MRSKRFEASFRHAKIEDDRGIAMLTVEAGRSGGKSVYVFVLDGMVGSAWMQSVDWAGADWGEWDSSDRDYRTVDAAKLPSWSRLPDFTTSWTLDDLPMAPEDWGLAVSSGWPRRSASYFAIMPSDLSPGLSEKVAVRDGIVIEGVTIFDDTLPRVIPLAIYWSGAIFNTLVYAAVLLVPFVLVPWTRHHLRRRAGRCTACGYDLRGADHDVCPECGTPKSFAPSPST